MSEIKIFCDGGSRGNPGPSAGGFVVKDSQRIIYKKGIFFGLATNNLAEYLTLLAAMKWLKNNYAEADISEAVFFLDSQLVVRQLRGEYRIKSKTLTPIVIKIQSLIKSLPVKISFVHLSRDKNKEADTLVNRELDRHAS